MVLKWLATKKGQVFYDQYLERKIAQASGKPVPEVQLDLEKALNKTYIRIRQHEAAGKRTYWIGVAATLSLIVVSTWLYINIYTAKQTLVTAYGERQEFVMNDGTKVTLNANSQLQYQADHPREVWLRGEGYFDVAHTQGEDLFQVHTDDLTINVLGTIFNVQARHDQTDVVLSRGKVVLTIDNHPKNESVLMVPGEKVSFSQKTDIIERGIVNPETYTTWTKGTLLFDHTSLKDIFSLLEDHYGVDIQVKNKELLTKELSGRVELKLPIILTMIEKSFDLKIHRKTDIITIEK